MATSEIDLEELQDVLEQQELLSNNTQTPAEVYAQLLVTYLIQNDLVNSKFLWQRIPTNIKTDKELENIWKIGKLLWKREFNSFFNSITNETWSSVIAPLMVKLRESQRERLVNLVTQSYSIISFSKLEQLIGCDEVQLTEIASVKLWELDIENKMVKINNLSTNLLTMNLTSVENEEANKQCDRLLNKLTNYVTFLEN